MRNYKIFYLSRAELPSEVSHSLSIYNLCLAFARAGSNVLLFGVDSGKGDITNFYGKSHEKLEIVLLKIFPLLRLRFIKWLQLSSIYIAIMSIRQVKEFKPDIIYSRLTLLEMLFLPKSIPIYYEMHSLGIQGKRKFYDVIFRRLLKYKNFSKIIVTTEELKDILISKYKDTKIINAPLSAEEPVEINFDKLKIIQNNTVNYYEYTNHIGYTGFLDDSDLRGMSTLLDIAEVMTSCYFHVVGGNSEMKKLWQARANSRGINNINFYGYRVPTEIPYLLKLFDVVLAPLKLRPIKRAPSGQNMSPLKLAQYMAYSKAIVASDIPSHHEILQNGINALLVKYDSISSWVNAIEKILHNPNLKLSLESEAKKTYDLNYTPKKRIELILNQD
jgi:glycosyltransferase involved in cell wall biosynthesis